MISCYWINGLVLWDYTDRGHTDPYYQFIDGWCCPIKFEVL